MSKQEALQGVLAHEMAIYSKQPCNEKNFLKK
jgi:hypothetical protein